MKTLDLRGLNCPLPLLRTKKALFEMAEGEQLRVQTSDPNSPEDLRLFCEKSGNRLLEFAEENGAYLFLIQKSTVNL